MKFRRQPAQEVSINMTPLIDVVFLLLIFFMVSTTFTKETRLEIDLPEAAGEVVAAQSRDITLEISEAGSYAIGGQVIEGNSVEVIKSAIERASGGDNTIPLIISADAQTPHEAVVVAMEAVGQAGFVKLSIATREPETK
ncbi:biopolymer transporter ExbD [Sansalvadorimonas sp. 2012CJ34-2]|uniref:Biopolymer transporter ExbD n=1 Tax=Parendozoicomonas callyspongiae TaxID=2942213 RepID=A0ABT0PEI4_9GAMM|nr:biopolymer transporter ExbD [Sansalvadorimonas sp. 2012CJ34-2]MCL6269793.1 biopolymer transporter ExbD [Sansalvadorimonas sp. 2012CJ34-2]